MAREGQDNLMLSSLTGIALLLCSVCVGQVAILLMQPYGRYPLLVVAGVALTATFLFLVISRILPSLFGSQGLVWPLTLSLPIVFVTLLVLSAILWSNQDSALVRPSDQFEALEIWKNPIVLATLTVTQFALLTILDRKSVG